MDLKDFSWCCYIIPWLATLKCEMLINESPTKISDLDFMLAGSIWAFD
jgi:hypothetical protein